MSKKKKHAFDLEGLENNLRKTHAAFLDNDTPETRTAIFIDIRELAYAILRVGPFRKYAIEYEKTAYEYALYLFERIVIGSFTPKNLKSSVDGSPHTMPWQFYISKNIKHVIFNMREDKIWHEMVSDLEFLLDEVSIEYKPDEIHIDQKIDRFNLATKLLRIMTMYYSLEETKRLLNISMDLIFSNANNPISSDLPLDVKDFTVILISSSKRLIADYNINSPRDIPKNNLKRALASSVRSTIFLSTVVNSSFFPRELLLSLDIDSLYRLVNVLGGQTIRVPTSRELDSLLGAVVSVSKMIMEGKNINDSIKESKVDYSLLFSTHINIQSYVSKILETLNIFREDTQSDPLINILLMSIGSLDSMMKSVSEKAKNGNASTILDSYKELASTFNQFTESLVKISAGFKSPSQETYVSPPPIPSSGGEALVQ